MVCLRASNGHGPDDTFFVEGEATNIYTQRAGARDRAKQAARLVQASLATQLADVTAEESRDDILGYLLSVECDDLPDVNSIDIQTEIKWYMRPYLVEFLIEAHASYQLLPETLHLAINLLDRYCSRRVVYKRHYQLVGCSALLVAAKYGDKKERVPQIKELKSMCCSLYDEDMFLQMEWHLLITLQWSVGNPTVDTFLQLALSERSSDFELERMTWYLSEVALFHKEFVSVAPSVLARTVLTLAVAVLERVDRNHAIWASPCEPALVSLLYDKVQDPSKVLAQKYSSVQNSCVANTVQSFMHRQMQPRPQEAYTWNHCHGMANAPITTGTHPHPLTPQKPQAQMSPNGVNAYMTPPITPDGPMFVPTVQMNKPVFHSAGVPQLQLTPPSTLEDLLHRQAGYPY